MFKVETESLNANLLALLNEASGIEGRAPLSSLSDFLPPGASADSPYSTLLELLVHLEFSEEEAIHHWIRIIQNGAEIREKLGRNIGIHVATVDYFTNVNSLLSAPMLIEIHVFKQTEQLAMIDGLTGAFNRRYMDIVLKKEFNRCERYQKSLSICMLDIDNFKRLNDSRGHSFGDLVLKELSAMLKDMVREEDFVCRYGGEEFLIILPETEENGAGNFASRLMREEKTRPFFVENGITFSGGTATYPGAARDIDGLVQAADRALYKAKNTGKDQITNAEAERRKFGRYSHSWSLNVHNDTSATPITGLLTQNISRGGIQFKCHVQYTLETPLNLVFSNKDSNIPEIEAKGRITWIRKTPKGFIYGVSFEKANEIFDSGLSDNISTLK
jgi:two-component system cell cycle response regulator